MSAGFPQTFGALLRESARRHPDRTALAGRRGGPEGRRLSLSYDALDRAASRLANALVREGFAGTAAQPGRWLAILSPNDIDYPAVHFGAARAGCPLAHVSIRATAAGRAEMLDRIGAALLFVHADLAAEMRTLPMREGKPAPRIVVIGGGDGPESLAAFVAGAPESDPPVEVRPDDPAAITFSSGSTGAPKGVLVSHRNRTLASCLGAQAFELNDDDVLGCTTPLFHVAGLFMWLQLGIRRGLPIVLLEKWAPDRFADAIVRDGVTAAFLVPSQVAALLDHPAAQTLPVGAGGLRHLNISGAPMPPGLLERALDAWPGLDIVEHYGQSESCPLAYRPAAFARSKPASAGRPCVEMATLDDAGRPLPAGETGEVASRGDHTLLGYIGDAESLERLRAGDGWLRTGDIGRIDEDGFLHLIDRARDVIVSGGENIFPAEIERALHDHPAVRECAVFGVPDERWGEVPAAHVVAAEPVAEAALIDFVAARVPRYKRPRFIEFVDSLPRTAIGKIRKGPIRAAYWKGRDRAI